MAKKTKEEPQQYQPGSFSTAKDAFEAGKASKLSNMNFADWQSAYKFHDNRGSNQNAQMDFRKRFRLGWESVGTDIITT